MRRSLNAPLFFLSDLCRRIGSSLVSKESKTPKPKRRWLRRSLWLCLVLALLGVAAIGYLNQVGLPDFAKRELQERLAKRGPFRTANGRQGARTIFPLPLGGEGGRRPDEGAATRPPNTSSIGFTPAL